MAFVSFVDDNALLAYAYVNKQNSILKNTILSSAEKYLIKVIRDDFFIALDLSVNKPLSKLYNDMFYVVRVVMDHVTTAHLPQQEAAFEEVFTFLKQYMDANPGYYNLRMPVHVIDVLRTVNRVLPDHIFCGGTVELLSSGEQYPLNTPLHIFFADHSYIQKEKQTLKNIAYDSFKEYQGQYHISEVTQEHAGRIYENWLFSSFENYRDNVIVAEYKERPIGFVLIGENDKAVDIALGVVVSGARGMRGYKMMSAFAMNYACEKGKIVTASTQLDNFYAQRAWAAIGMQPYYSIYNIHFDRRKKDESIICNSVL